MIHGRPVSVASTVQFNPHGTSTLTQDRPLWTTLMTSNNLESDSSHGLFTYQFRRRRWYENMVRFRMCCVAMGPRYWRFHASMQCRSLGIIFWKWRWRSSRRSSRRSPWRSLWRPPRRPLWWPRFLELSASRWGYFLILLILYKLGWNLKIFIFLEPFIYSSLDMNFANFRKIAVPTKNLKKKHTRGEFEHSESHPCYYFCDFFPENF